MYIYIYIYVSYIYLLSLELLLFVCSRRLTRVVFVRGLSSRARAPSFCSVCEYLKRSGQRGALAAVCTPTIKSASEKHQSGTPPYRNTVNGCAEGGPKIEY